MKTLKIIVSIRKTPRRPREKIEIYIFKVDRMMVTYLPKAIIVSIGGWQTKK
jgi:hypothetical protein